MRALRIRSPQDVAGGLVLVVLAAIAAWQAADLDMGRTSRMGPGYFPTVLSGLIALFGAGIALRGLRVRGDGIAPFRWRRLLPVLLAITLFGLLIRPAGLVLASVVLLLVASVAAPDFRWRGTLIFGAGLILFAVILFPILLGLPLSIWPRF